MNGDDIQCPRCKTTKYNNPSLRLLVNVCGHPLCENCIELMFANGAAKCFQCPTPLKRGNFKKQLFQDSQVEKDVQVRRDILRKFHKDQESFPSLRAYNDYLEKLEIICYNLANDVDVDEANMLLEELRRPTTDTSRENLKQMQKKQLKVENEPYRHKYESLLIDGPKLPALDDKYLRAIRSFSTKEVAGGFTAQLAISRAMSEAFIGLFARGCKTE